MRSRLCFKICLLGVALLLTLFSSARAAVPIKNAKATKSGKDIKVTWDSIPEIKTYKVFKPDGALYPNGNVGENTSYVLKDAKENTNYIFKIRGYRTGSTSASGDAQGEVTYVAAPAGNGGGGSTDGTSVDIGAPFPNESPNVDLIQHVIHVYNWAAGIGSLLATLMIILAGFKYITSSGNPEALQDAKDTIVGALIGLAVIILSFLLLQIVGVQVQ